MGWGCCLFGEKVWTEMAAAAVAAAVDWGVAVVQVDADVAALRC